jgi:hypothetical protein
MLCDRGVVEFEKRFGERKLEHDLARVIRHFDGGAQEAMRPFGLEQFLDHGPGYSPCMIGILEFFALWIDHQFIADSGVEEISWHETKPVAEPYARGIASHKWLTRKSRGGDLAALAF